MNMLFPAESDGQMTDYLTDVFLPSFRKF